MKALVALSLPSILALTGCSAASDLADDFAAPTGTDVAGLTCADLVEESIAISEDQDISLLKVRVPKMLKDNRPMTEDDLPTGAGEKLVLSCVGTGVWSDGDSRTKVKMSLKIDADSELFIYYEAI